MSLAMIIGIIITNAFMMFSGISCCFGGVFLLINSPVKII